MTWPLPGPAVKVGEAGPPTTETVARWFLYLKATVPPETGAPVASLVTLAVAVKERPATGLLGLADTVVVVEIVPAYAGQLGAAEAVVISSGDTASAPPASIAAATRLSEVDPNIGVPPMKMVGGPAAIPVSKPLA